MRELKIDDKTYPIYGTGETVLIYSDEFHDDLFMGIDRMNEAVSKNKLSTVDIAKIEYALIRTADPSFKTGFRDFMKSIHKVNSLISERNLMQLIPEINEMMDDGNGPDPSTDEAKKKTVKQKKA